MNSAAEGTCFGGFGILNVHSPSPRAAFPFLPPHGHTEQRADENDDRNRRPIPTRTMIVDINIDVDMVDN